MLRIRRAILIPAGLAFWLLGTLLFYRHPWEIDHREQIQRRIIYLENSVELINDRLEAQNNETNRLLGVMGDLVREKKNRPPSIAVLIIACNRPVAAKAHLEKLISLRPSKESFPIVVSQDCAHEPTANIIRSFGDQISFIQQPDQSDIEIPVSKKKYKNYYKISRHYKWALTQVFSRWDFDSVIITEDDLDISVDFFDYFLATHSLLVKDPSLWCVSAWNDNGKAFLIDSSRPEALYRTDFFPGLGWMMPRAVWEELSPKWPAAFWDDWMREPAQRKDRACIRPEISRTAMSSFGAKGVSKGLWYQQHLKHIVLNTAKVDFGQLDLSFLVKNPYDTDFTMGVAKCGRINYLQVSRLGPPSTPNECLLVPYSDAPQFHAAAKKFNLMNDFRSGVPRMAYRGIVSFMLNGYRVHLTPTWDWAGYDSSWN